MIQIRSRLRRWGNSLGVVVPQRAIETENAKEGDEVTIIFNKDEENVLEEMFGTFKFKKPIDQIMKEVDEELDNE
ncbi:MAG: AbrB/MazE/SpoVT family DNA-binding domain-containing protein [archaeon]